jgi:hypothetical protein
MPLCGFNPKMVEGLRLFSVGLMEATLERGRSKQQADAFAIDVEVSEIELFLDEMETMFGRDREMSNEVARMIAGVALFSQGFLRRVRAAAPEENSDLSIVSDRCSAEIANLLDELEIKHQELKVRFSAAETMRRSVEWIEARTREEYGEGSHLGTSLNESHVRIA